MVESKTFKNPFGILPGGDYRWNERFRVQPSEDKLKFIKDPVKGEFDNLGLILTEEFRFSSDPEFGLEAADIATNTIRRSLMGNFSRHGWLAIRQLMIHRPPLCIRMMSLAHGHEVTPSTPYMEVLKDFRQGGRLMLPAKYLDEGRKSSR